MDKKMVPSEIKKKADALREEYKKLREAGVGDVRYEGKYEERLRRVELALLDIYRQCQHKNRGRRANRPYCKDCGADMQFVKMLKKG